jgi:hypothetical protein
MTHKRSRVLEAAISRAVNSWWSPLIVMSAVLPFQEISGKSPLRDISHSYGVSGTAGISVQF